jgi:hypothetical protein
VGILALLTAILGVVWIASGTERRQEPDAIDEFEPYPYEEGEETLEPLVDAEEEENPYA